MDRKQIKCVCFFVVQVNYCICTAAKMQANNKQIITPQIVRLVDDHFSARALVYGGTHALCVGVRDKKRHRQYITVTPATKCMHNLIG